MKSRRSKATDISQKVKKTVWERDNQCCIICESPYAMPNAHYISRANGGLGIEQNIVTLCQKCHNDFDNGTEEKKLALSYKIESYLTACYEDWNVENLYYKKYI